MPRAGLSAPVVVAEAARLVDELGPHHLTMAAVAQRFGVAVPSLYKHVSGIEDLQNRLAALAVGELGEAVAVAAVGKAGDDALLAMAVAYRAYATAHPGRYLATLRAPSPEDTEHEAAAAALLQTVFAVLSGYGLVGDDAVDATRMVHSALHGFVSLEAAGSFGMPQDVDRSYERMVGALEVALASWERRATPDRRGRPASRTG